MPETARRRSAAPIDYREMRAIYQTVRLVMALLLAGLGVVGMIQVGGSPITTIAGGMVTADALIRRSRGDSPIPSIVLDIIVFGSVLLIRGEAPYSEAAGGSFIIVAALLLLPIVHAVVLTGLAALFGGVIVLWSPLLDSEPGFAEMEGLDRIGMLVFLGGTATLLVLAGRTLRRMREENVEALETERRAARLKDEFVSMVSHELRTPLTSISGFTDTLRESWPALEGTEIEEFLTIMAREAGHLGELVEDILVIPRLEAGRLRLETSEVDLRAAAYSVVDAIVTPEEPKEAFVAIPGGVVVHADPVRIRQVLRNLVENARKYGGDQILIEGGPEGDRYIVVVSDNGPGIAEEDRDRIFEHFEQVTKGDARTESGIGLGLPIARRLVRAMGGELWYEQRFPVGARFCFSIPLATMRGPVEERRTVVREETREPR
jgi:signal transduction histidine kinase